MTDCAHCRTHRRCLKSFSYVVNAICSQKDTLEESKTCLFTAWASDSLVVLVLSPFRMCFLSVFPL